MSTEKNNDAFIANMLTTIKEIKAELNELKIIKRSIAKKSTKRKPARKVKRKPARKVKRKPARKVKRKPARKVKRKPARKVKRKPARRRTKSKRKASRRR
jgi:hypothetical protein